MKYLLNYLLLACLPTVTYAQTWQWINTGGGTNLERGKSVAIAPDGTIFCMGENQSSTTHFGPINLSSVGAWNTFVCTYTSSGSLVNATATSGNTGIGGTIAASGIKNTECSSYFINASFAGGAFFDTVYVNMIGAVTAKYNENARCLWVKPIENDIQYRGMAMYGSNLYAQGEFSKPVVHIDTFALDTSKGTGFIARLDTNGKCLWTKQYKGTHPELKHIKNGRIFSFGQSGGGLDYDSLHVTISDTLFTYIIQTDTGGKVKSYNILRGVAIPRAISSDLNRNYYVYGNFYYTSIIGTDTLYLLNNAQQDGFLSKYDSIGGLIWVKQFYSNDQVFTNASSTDNEGNTYLTGVFTGNMVMGTDTFRLAAGMYAMFVARYNTNGDCLGVKIVEGTSGLDITQDNNGNAIVTGQTGGGSNFDNLPFTAYGGGDFFVAKLGAITGITTSMDDEKLVIYPNPNQKLFTIEVPQSVVQANSVQLDIYDNVGNSVQHGTVGISNGKVRVDIGTVQKGIYNVILSTSKKKFTGRVVVE